MATPHDNLFRLAFGRPANARDLLRKALPRAIAERIDWRRLRKSQTDLLFSAVLHGRRVLLYVLIEHKSRDDRWTVLDTAGRASRSTNPQRVRTGDAKELEATLRGWGQLMERLRASQSGQDDLLTVFSYLFEVAGLPDEQLHTILTDITPRSTHKMFTAADHIRRRVRPKFQAEGQARGLLRLLKKKFGRLPPRIVARVKRASTPTLDRWFDHVLTAKVLDDVFAEGSST